MQDTQNLTLTIKEQVIKILKNYNEPDHNVECYSFLNNDIQFYIVTVKQVSSTMLLSANMPNNFLNHNVVIGFVAEKQLKGRGQKNNEWVSPQGNIYLTILMKISLQPLTYLTMIVTAGICKLIAQQLKVQLNIKWVNDIYLQNKKAGGILTKVDIEGTDAYIQLGIGLNVANSSVPQSDYLQKYCQQLINPGILAKSMTIWLAKDILSSKDSKQKVIKQYEQRLIYRGQEVNIFDEKLETIKASGVFVGINQYGFVKLKTGNQQKVISDGRMRLKNL